MPSTRWSAACAALLVPCSSSIAAPPEFRAQVIDDEVAIGYGLAVGDVDGDGRIDVVLADQHQFVWYRAPDWERTLLWKNPAARDNVCVAAADFDGDGKLDIAGGAEWAPGDRVASGSVHWFAPGADRTLPWTAVDLHREPTVHRMAWARNRAGTRDLIVVPLHGRGNDPAWDGVRILAYRAPEDRSDAEAWSTELVDAHLHAVHNLDLVAWDDDPEDEILLASREGIYLADRGADRWMTYAIAGNAPGESTFAGASEVRLGRGAGGRYIATVEPFHGNQVVAYTPSDAPHGPWSRRVLCDDLAEAHALACGSLDGGDLEHLVVGWRRSNPAGKVGVRIYTPPAEASGEWSDVTLDDGGMACEDLRLADLDGDGDLDVVAAGRATHNVKIYWNASR